MSTNDCQPTECLAPPRSEVVSNRRIGPGWYVLRLREESIARRSKPGTQSAPKKSEDVYKRRRGNRRAKRAEA